MYTEDLYEDMKCLKSSLDLSEYPKDHPLYDITNKKVPLKMSDELKGAVVKEAVFLKPKAYSILSSVDGSEKTKKSAKGVNTQVKREINHETFKHVLESAEILRKKMTRIASTKHEISLMTLNKIALTAYDDKRYYMENGIDSLAYGHYKTGYVKTNNDDDDDEDDEVEEDAEINERVIDEDPDEYDDNDSFIDNTEYTNDVEDIDSFIPP